MSSLWPQARCHATSNPTGRAKGQRNLKTDLAAEGAIILVMQRLHEDDLTGHLLRDGGWTHLSLPAIATADEEIVIGNGRIHVRHVRDVLHSEREPLSVLDELRRNLGSAAFEAQYQQSPVPADGLRVKREWLRFYGVPLDRSGLRIGQSWDTALKGDPRADFSVCTTWGERNGQHYLFDVYREQLDFPDLIRAVVSLHRQYQPNAVLIEEQGSGISLIQTLRARHAIWPIGRRSKDDKETRLTTVTPMFESGQVLLPADAPWLAGLLHELFGFPNAGMMIRSTASVSISDGHAIGAAASSKRTSVMATITPRKKSPTRCCTRTASSRRRRYQFLWRNGRIARAPLEIPGHIPVSQLSVVDVSSVSSSLLLQ